MADTAVNMNSMRTDTVLKLKEIEGRLDPSRRNNWRQAHLVTQLDELAANSLETVLNCFLQLIHS